MAGTYLYDYDEAAALTGLSPITIRNYCFEGRYGLERGRDYTVLEWRHGRFRRRGVRLTRRGIERLQLRHLRMVVDKRTTMRTPHAV